MSCENKEVIRPGTAGSDKSDSTKKTQVQFERDQAQDGGHEKVGQMQNITNGPQDGDESAIPEDREVCDRVYYIYAVEFNTSLGRRH